MKNTEIVLVESLDNGCKKAEESLDLVANSLPIGKAIDKVKAEIKPLKETLRAQLDGTKTTTKNKQEERSILKTTFLWIGGVLGLYADDVGDMGLKAFTSLAPSRLGLLRDAKFSEFGQELVSRAEKIGTTVLEEYGLDEDTFQTLKDQINELTARIGLPRYTRGQLAAMQQQVRVRIKRARFILTVTLRNLLAPLSISHPDFWAGYEQSLLIFNTRGGKKKVATGEDNGNSTGDLKA